MKYKYFLSDRWLPGPEKSQKSGWSIFTIEIPTGYRIEERYLKDLVGFGTVRNLRDAENYLNSLNFIFEFVNFFQSFISTKSTIISLYSSLITHQSVGNLK